MVGGLLAEYFELLILGMDSEEIVAKAAEGGRGGAGAGGVHFGAIIPKHFSYNKNPRISVI